MSTKSALVVALAFCSVGALFRSSNVFQGIQDVDVAVGECSTGTSNSTGVTEESPFVYEGYKPAPAEEYLVSHLKELG